MKPRAISNLKPDGIQRVMHSFRGDGLRAKALQGSGWTLGGFGAQQVLRLGSSLVLTRLLFPEAFGYMALASVYMTGLEMFSDIGIRPAIIQNKRGDDIEFLNTAWTMQIIRGFVLWFVACVLAYPLSKFYETDILFPLLCVLGALAAIRGFQTTGYATKNKKLEMGVLAVIELASRLIGIVAMISWAMVSPTVWALAAGGITSSLASVILAHAVINTHRHRLVWDKGCAKELIGYGKWIFVSSVLTFIAQSGDRVLLPAVLDFQELAFFSLAVTFVMIPVQVIKRMSMSILFPAYSELVNNSSSEKLYRAVHRYTKVSMAVYLLPLLLLFGGKYIIETLYDERYHSAGPTLTILAVGCFFAILRASQSGILLAVGKPKRAMFVNLFKIPTYFTLGYYLSLRWGLDGFCAGYVASEAGAYYIQSQMIQAIIPRRVFKYERVVLLVVLCSVPIVALWVV